MAKSYANIQPGYDTFAAWLTRTNSLLTDMSTIIVTVDTTTNGAITTGNAYVNGFFGANTLTAVTGIRGGNGSTNASLNVLSSLVVSNSFIISLGNTTVNTTINATSFSGIANNANNLGGISLATVQGQITGNAATAYSNAVANATSQAATAYSNAVANAAVQAATAYSNAITIAANATNLSSGTVNPARLGSGTANSTTILYGNNVWAAVAAGVNTAAQYVFTNTFTVNATFSTANSTATTSLFASNGNIGIGNTTPVDRLSVGGTTYLGGNVTIANNMTLVANGAMGTSGQVLSSNGTGLYWGSLGAIGVNTAAQYTFTNTFIVSATFATSNSTANTSLFGSNGNVGIGNSTPIHKLSVGGTGFFSDTVTINGADLVLRDVLGSRELRAGNATVNTVINSTSISTGGVNANGVSAFTANVNLSNNNVINPAFKSYREFMSNVTVTTATQTLDLSTTNIFNLRLQNSSPIALTFSNPPAAGVMFPFTLILIQESGGSKTVTYPANVTTVCKFTDGVTPVLATANGKTDVVQFFTCDGGNTYFGAYAYANT